MSTISDVLRAAEIAGRLVPIIIEWVRALIGAGNSDEGAERIVRLSITDRTDEIARNRAAVDEALAKKHGRAPPAALAHSLDRSDVQAFLAAASPAVRAIIAAELSTEVADAIADELVEAPPGALEAMDRADAEEEVLMDAADAEHRAARGRVRE